MTSDDLYAYAKENHENGDTIKETETIRSAN